MARRSASTARSAWHRASVAKPLADQRDVAVARTRPRGVQTGVGPPVATKILTEPAGVLTTETVRTLAFTLALLALGIVSAWLYWRWLVQPYLLTRYVDQPLLD